MGVSCEGVVDTDAPELAAAMDLLRAELAVTGAPGGAVALYRDGEIVGLGAAGTRVPGACEPVTLDTLFRAGAHSNWLTAIATLDTVEDGALELDASITDAPITIGAEVGDPDEITIHHLLTNSSMYSSGADGPDLGPICGELAAYFASPVDALIQAAPGSMHNKEHRGNFEIAGLILQETVGDPYPQVVADRVLAPLGMGGGFVRSELDPDVLASTVPSSDCRQRDPSLGYYGSIRDMARLSQYVLQDRGEILTEQHHGALRANLHAAFWGSDFAGYGLDGSTTPSTLEVWWTFGHVDGYGYATFLFWHPSCPQEGACQFGATVLVNAGRDPQALALAVAKLVDPAASFDLPPFTPEAAAIAAAAGQYEDPIGVGSGPRTLVVTPGDPLELIATDPVTMASATFTQLDPPVEDTFQIENDFARFWRDPQGEVYAIQLQYNGPPFFRLP